jgi:hypothetical protein
LIFINGINSIATIEIVSTSGQLMRQITNDFTQIATIQVNTADLVNGVYFVRIITQEGVKVIKIDVAH